MARLALTALALLGAACASTSGGKKAEQELPSWPLPPDKPRIKFVRAFGNEDDMKKGFMRSALRVFVPASPLAVVKQPTGLALSPDERYLYIACASAGRVLRADLTDGRLELAAAAEGRSPTGPLAVAVDAGGNLYVTDPPTNSVWVYGPDGKFLRRWTEMLERPTGLAIDGRRQIAYVVSGVAGKSQHHRVEVFSLMGKHLRTIGTRGHEPGQFNFPANLAVAPDGNLYVVDMLNFRVQVFDPGGQLVGMFGTLGAGQPGTFDKAKSVAFDTFGNIYVVDGQQGFVQLFNAKYQPLMAFGGRLRLPGYLISPTAIATTSKNTIFVADFFQGLVNEYQLVNTTATDALDPDAGDATRAPTRTPVLGEKAHGG
jgi:DNA-binding beta-propeller fold protein YncE